MNPKETAKLLFWFGHVLVSASVVTHCVTFYRPDIPITWDWVPLKSEQIARS